MSARQRMYTVKMLSKLSKWPVATSEAIIRTLSPFVKPSKLETLEGMAGRKVSPGRVRLVLDGLSDEGNMFACLRTAEGIGLSRVDYTHGPEPDSASAVCEGRRRSARWRAAVGASQWLRVREWGHGERANCIQELKDDGFKIMVSLQPPTSTPIVDAQPFLADTDRLAIVFGNEAMGVSQEFQDAADLTFHLPMRGFVTSYNVSVSVGMTLGYLCHTGFLDDPAHRMDSEEQQEQVARWLVSTVKHAPLILDRCGVDLLPTP